MARQSKTGGKKTKATARKASPARDAKAAKIKRSVVPKLGKGRSVAELQAKLDFKTRELDEALAQQKATAEVLQVISNSSGDLPLVFDTMLDKAMHLCGAEFGVLANYDGETFRTAATRGLPYKYAAHRARSTRGYGPGTAPFRHLKGEPLVHIVDLMDSDAYRAGEPNRRALVDLGGARCLLCVPLLSDRRVIGCVMIFRQEARPFGDRQIALLKYFAAQAVIAIENARLFNETKEALERQTATADILKVIARSPADVQPVFDAIAKSAKRLSGAHSVVVTRVAADMVQLAAFTAESEAADQELQASYPFPLSSSRVHSQVARSGKIKLQTNIESDPEIPQTSKDLARARGYRSLVVVPMLREGGAIGTIGVSRREAGPFTENILHLLCAFADQAVIAIENARLFKETQEALEQQKASADILSVISNSVADTQPVFDKILHSIENLFESEFRVIFLFGDDELLHVGAMHGPNADQCESAWGPEADRHDKSLNLLRCRGSSFGAE